MPSSINRGTTIGEGSSSPAGKFAPKPCQPGALSLISAHGKIASAVSVWSRAWAKPHPQSQRFTSALALALTPLEASAMHRQSTQRQWRAAPALPTCSSRALPVPCIRSQRAAKANASRAAEDGARQRLAAPASSTARSRCRPVAAGRDAPVLEAVDFPQGWQGEQRSEEPERHASLANGHSSSAEPSSLAHAATAVAEAIPTTEASIAASSATDSAATSSVPASELAHAAGELDPASSAAAVDAASATEAADSSQPAEPFQGLGELADIEELRGVRVQRRRQRQGGR